MSITGKPPVGRPPSPGTTVPGSPPDVRDDMPAPPLPQPLPPDPVARLKNFAIVGVAAVLGYFIWR
jgi:hypothetical protein